jgi:hypothetical protein
MAASNAGKESGLSVQSSVRSIAPYDYFAFSNG